MTMELDLKGKHAVVTGGANGLCYDIAKAYYEAGAELCIVDIAPNIAEAAKKLGKDREVKYYSCDLSNLEHIPADYEAMKELCGGRIDILFNGAGIQYREKAEDFPIARWKLVLDINLNAVFVLSQLAGRDMLAQGYGRIINMASMTSFFGSEMVPAYASSKGAIAQLTKSLSNEWASRGVHVNAIAPGYMVTKLTADMEEKNPAQYKEITNRIPMKRWGTGQDLGGLAVFLASSAADYITGAVIPVDGGYLGK